MDENDDERDWHQEFKDDVAMGYIDRDGNQLDPPEPDWTDDAPADCEPPPTEPPEDPWAAATGEPMPGRPDWWTPGHEAAALEGIRDGIAAQQRGQQP